MPVTWSARTATAPHAACSERNTVEAERKISDRRSLCRFSLTNIRTRTQSIQEVLHGFLPFFIQDRGCDISLDFFKRPYSGRSPLKNGRDMETELSLKNVADSSHPQRKHDGIEFVHHFPAWKPPKIATVAGAVGMTVCNLTKWGATSYLGIRRLYARARSFFIVLLIDVLDDMSRMDEFRCDKPLFVPLVELGDFFRLWVA